jgi:general secretion pathway protein B
MSFILDALKKSETDRQRQATPALFEVKVAAPRRGFPLWAIGLAVLLVINIGILAWVLGRHAGAAAPVATSLPATSNAPAQPAPANAPSPGEVTVPATVTFQVNVPANAAPAGIPVIAPEPGVVAPSNAPPLTEDPLLSGQEPTVPPDYDTHDYQAAITPEQAAAIAATRRAGGVPSRDEALARGTQLPDLRLDLHVYDGDPAKRFVFINMRKLREGESLPEGVRVEEILKQGARLSYRGNQFTLEGN